MKLSCSMALALALVLALPITSTFAKNDNSSAGTKELLTRIEALEAAVGALGGTDNKVTGATYRMNSLGGGLAAFLPFPGNFHLLFGGSHDVTFNSDGTGTWVVLFCYNEQLSEIANDPPDLKSIPCGTFAANGFTYSQAGSDLAVTDVTTNNTITLTVSTDGSALVSADLNSQGGGGVFDLSAGVLLVGVRVSD